MEMKRYTVTMFGSEHSREVVAAGLDKYFRRRALADTRTEDGSRLITLRNRATIVVRSKPSFGGAREPFLEMDVTATEEYLKRSVDAVYKHARSHEAHIDVSAKPYEEPPPRRSKIPPSAQPQK